MRPSKDDYFLSIARVVSSRATCYRRQVGCVLVNERGHILSTGYNGVAMGAPHCNEIKLLGDGRSHLPSLCRGALAGSGYRLDECEAIHAEQNALLQCRDVWSIGTCYVTVFPCIHCVKLLLNTSCRRIVYESSYAHQAAHDLWINNHRDAHQLRRVSAPTTAAD